MQRNHHRELVMMMGKINASNATETIFGVIKRNRRESRKSILLLGPQGAGKSSLINSIVNYLHKVKEETPYRLHVVGREGSSEEDNGRLLMEPTTSVNSFVFHGTRISQSIAFIDTPPIGNTSEVKKEGSACERIRKWYASSYDYPCKDLEVWLVLSAQEPNITNELIFDLREIIEDLDTTNVKIIPVITFSKQRKPVLALRALESIGFPTELENIDYFLVNNSSVVSTVDCSEQTNALTFKDTILNIRMLLIMATEPQVTIGSPTNTSSLLSSPISDGRSSSPDKMSFSAGGSVSSHDHIYAIPFKPPTKEEKEVQNLEKSVGTPMSLVSISSYETMV